MANKTTKMDNFTAIYNFLVEAGQMDYAAVIAHEMELLQKKNSSRSDKPTARQVENQTIGEKVVSLLEKGKYYRLTEIKNLIPELADSEGTQRIAVICKTLAEAGKLEKSVDKRVVYYTLAN